MGHNCTSFHRRVSSAEMPTCQSANRIGELYTRCITFRVARFREVPSIAVRRAVRSCGSPDANLTRHPVRVVDARCRSVGGSAGLPGRVTSARLLSGEPNAKETRSGRQRKKVIVALRDGRYLANTRRCRMVCPRIVGPCHRGGGKSGAQRGNSFSPRE